MYSYVLQNHLLHYMLSIMFSVTIMFLRCNHVNCIQIPQYLLLGFFHIVFLLIDSDVENFLDNIDKNT